MKVLKDWAIPASVVIATTTGAWVRLEHVIEEHGRAIQELRESIDRSSGCGPDGFLSPASHISHDLHILHWLEEQLGRKGWRDLVNEYTTANGGSD